MAQPDPIPTRRIPPDPDAYSLPPVVLRDDIICPHDGSCNPMPWTATAFTVLVIGSMALGVVVAYLIWRGHP